MAELACIFCGVRLSGNLAKCRGCNKAVYKELEGRFQQDRFIKRQNCQVAVVARDRVTGRETYLRFLTPDASAEELAGFHAEAAALTHLPTSMYGPGFIAVGKLRQTTMPYIACEYLKGKTLDKVFRHDKSVDALELFAQALETTAYLHASGYVHCALSLRHFILTNDGRVVLIDFRQTRPVGSPSGNSGIAGFQAPEQLSLHAPVVPATDVFALGACLYLALTKRLAYGRGTSNLHKHGFTPRLPSALNSRLDGHIDNLLLQALDRSPDHRFADAVEFHRAIHEGYGTKTDPDGAFVASPSGWILVVEQVGKAVVWTATTIVTLCVGTMRFIIALGPNYIRAMTAITGLSPRGVIAATMCAVAVPVFFYLQALPSKRKAPSQNINTSNSHVSEADTQTPPQQLSTQDPEDEESRFHLIENAMAALSLPKNSGNPNPDDETDASTMAPDSSLILDVLPLSLEEELLQREAQSLTTLEASIGTIEIHAWPPSEIYIDGQFIVEAPSPYRFELLSGKHQLEVRSNRGERKAFLITIESDEVLYITLNFDKNELMISEVYPWWDEIEFSQQ